MKAIKTAVDDTIKGLEKKVQELAVERAQYRWGSPFEIFLGGVIQGIQFASSFPYGGITMRSDIEAKSQKQDKRTEYICGACNNTWLGKGEYRTIIEMPKECPKCKAGPNHISFYEPKTQGE